MRQAWGKLLSLVRCCGRTARAAAGCLIRVSWGQLCLPSAHPTSILCQLLVIHTVTDFGEEMAFLFTHLCLLTWLTSCRVLH